MVIFFKKLRWKNFLSTGNVFTEIDLVAKDTTLIIGQNGAGKSTILDAVTFGLFGKPFRKINKPQLVNSITQKNLLVEVEFNIGTNQYKIVRGMKPTVFEVYQNDKLLNQSAEIKDYQEILEKQILKFNQKSFSQVVILGSATFQPFMQLPSGQRREVIEDLLDLQIFTIMNSLLKDKVLYNSGNITNILNEKKVLESKIELTKQHVMKVNESNANNIKDKEAKIEKNQKQIDEYEESLEKIDNNIDALNKEIVDESSVSKKVNKITKIRHQLETKMGMIDSELTFFNENDNCPTCKQNIDRGFKEKTIEEKIGGKKEIEDGLKLLNLEYETVNNRLNQIMNVISEIRKLELQRIEYKTTVNSLIKYNKSLEEDIKNLKQNIDSSDQDNIVEFEQELQDIEEKYNQMLDEKNVLYAAGILLKDNGIKSKIIKQYIPVINKLINKYLSSMDFFVSFELDEQFNETIKSRYRDDFTYASFSEGEKQKIDLALLFTWRAVAKLRNSISTNLLIMDEVFDSSLDQNATDYLMSIILDVSKDSNIFIISHKEHMNEKFTNVLKFIKHKNFSQIQE